MLHEIVAVLLFTARRSFVAVFASPAGLAAASVVLAVFFRRADALAAAVIFARVVG